MPRQNKGLGDMVQGHGNRLAPSLFAIAKRARTDSGGISHEQARALFLKDQDRLRGKWPFQRTFAMSLMTDWALASESGAVLLAFLLA